MADHSQHSEHNPHTCSHIRIAGAYTAVHKTHIKIAGSWVHAKKTFEKLQGTWHQLCHLPSHATTPIFTGAIGNQKAIAGEPFTLDVSKHWSTGSAPTSYSIHNEPAGMTISDAGVITWPAPIEINASGISVTATNSGGFSVSDAFGITVIALGPEAITGLEDIGFSETVGSHSQNGLTQTINITVGKLKYSPVVTWAAKQTGGHSYRMKLTIVVRSGSLNITAYDLFTGKISREVGLFHTGTHEVILNNTNAVSDKVAIYINGRFRFDGDITASVREVLP